ncbi:malate dehydrogenase [Cardamine amara subsp. amara]|uniref:Malate dehydrogenase n=1 Tax=Cardamine amara subsp. amara TaxID=228776 RepID=A0ABD1B0T1_CARAN
MVKRMVQSVAAHAPKAFILIASNIVNSAVPLAAEVLKEKGVYDPKKLFGMTSFEVSVVKSIVRQVLQTNLVDVPVCAFLSKTKPSLNYTEEEMEKLAVKIQYEVSFAKSGFGTFSLLTAHAVEAFLSSLLRALDGVEDVYEFAFVASTVTELPYFASRVKLGKNGIEAVIDPDLHGLAKYEEKALEALKTKLKASIEKGIAFAAEGN